MSKLEQQLRLSLIDSHMRKADNFLKRADIAINKSLAQLLVQHATQHLEEAEKLRDELQASA